MEFTYHGQHVVLRGITIRKPQLMPQEQLAKALKTASHLCMLQLIPSSDMSCLSIEREDKPNILVTL